MTLTSSGSEGRTTPGTSASGKNEPGTSASDLNPANVARRHPAVLRLLRVGWFAKGVVYVLAGVLAMVVWRHSRAGTSDTNEASPTGALEAVAHASGGRLLLAALTVGLLAYVAWRVLSVLMPGCHDLHGVVHRIGYGVSALLYASLAFTAFTLVRDGGADRSTDGNGTVAKATAEILDHTAGRWLIGAVGVITIAAALYRAQKGARRDVNDELDLATMRPEPRRWVRWLAAVGEIGRGVAIGLVGFFLVRAAWNYDANEATGLDGALRRPLEHAWGEAVVVVVGVGFVCYGVFCLATFRRRRLEAA